MSVQVVPSGLLCHFTVGVGVPEAAAVKVAVLPALAVWLVGWVVMDGAEFTVNVATFVATSAVMLLVNRARYFVPLSAVVSVPVV